MNDSMIRRLQCRKKFGFISSYLLYGLTLVGIVGMAYGRLSSEKQQAHVVQASVEELVAQVEVVRSKVFLCTTVFNTGDHGQFAKRRAFPAPPAAQGYTAELKDVRCPGSPGASANLSQLGDLIPLPRTVAGFKPWMYKHTELEGVQLILEPVQPGSATSIQQRLVTRYFGSSSLNGDRLTITLVN